MNYEVDNKGVQSSNASIISLTDNENTDKISDDSLNNEIENKNINSTKSNLNRYFCKLKDSNLITEILMFLNLSNVRTLIFVNRRLRKHLLINDERVLRKLGNMTYGLDKYKDFEGNPRGEITIKAIKSNIQPVEYMLLINDLDLIVSAPGTYEEGLTLWRQSTGIFEAEIRYKDDYGERGFVTSLAMCLYEESYMLAVAYSDGDLFLYDIGDSHKLKINSSDAKQPKVKWSKKVGTSDAAIKKMTYVRTKSSLITLEINSDLLLNVIKQFAISTGEQTKSSVVTNVIVTSIKCFDLYEEVGYVTFLVLGLSDGKLALKNLLQLEGGYAEITPNYYFYGHEGAITDLLYFEASDMLVSSGSDLYIFFWDVKKKVALRQTDTLHDDVIINMSYINEEVFASCSKDRTIMLWSTQDCSHIRTLDYHKSTVNCISYNEETRCLFSASYDKNIRSVTLGDSYQIEESRIINGHVGSVSSAKLDYISGVFITASMDKTVKIWDFANMSLMKSIESRNEFYDDFIVLHDEFNSLVKVDMTKKVKCVNTKTEKVYHTIDEASPARSILNLCDAVSFLVGLSNAEISCYNYYTSSDRNIFKKKRTYIHAEGEIVTNKTLKIKKLVFLNYERKVVASGATDGSVCVFYLKENCKVFIPSIANSEVDSLCPVSLKNKEIFAYSVGEKLLLYDLVSRSYVSELFLGKICCMDRLSDDYLVVSYEVYGGSSNSIHIYDTKENKIINKNEVSYKNVRQIYYMKDGNRIITLSGDNSIGFAMDVITFEEMLPTHD